jgi:hypothetical protein
MKHCWLFVLLTVILGCSEVVPGSCYPNPAGGAGGADSVTVGVGVGAGSGDFISPPPGGPLDYGGEPDPCATPPKDCNASCKAGYAVLSRYCQNPDSVPGSKRKTCEQSASAALDSCLRTKPDTGCDSPCENLQLVFQPFCRDPALNKKQKEQCWNRTSEARAACLAKS